MSSKNTPFRPSKAEAKADSTTRIVKGIVEAETAERHAKTARLRAGREERDASEAALQAAAPRKQPSKKPAARVAQPKN